NNFASAGVAQEWKLAAINPNDMTQSAITQMKDVHFTGSSFTFRAPMQSVFLFVLRPAGSGGLVAFPTSQMMSLSPSSTPVTSGATAEAAPFATSAVGTTSTAHASAPLLTGWIAVLNRYGEGVATVSTMAPDASNEEAALMPAPRGQAVPAIASSAASAV